MFIRNKFPGRDVPDKPVTENFGSIPLDKLQQIVELCVQLVREGRHLNSSNVDLELGNATHEKVGAISQDDTPPGNGVAERQTNQDVVDGTFEVGYLAFQERDNFQNLPTFEEVWRGASPFKLGRLKASKQNSMASESLYRQFRTINDLGLFQDGSFRGEGARHGEFFCKTIDLYLKSWGGTARPGLIALICREFGNGTARNIGDILNHCYENGVLERIPEATLAQHLQQISEVVLRFIFLNQLRRCGGWGLNSHENRQMGLVANSAIVAGELKHIFAGRKLSEVLGLGPARIMRPLDLSANNQQVRLEGALGSTFRLGHLDTKSLQFIGRLRIKWTLIAENHLCLDVEEKTLAVFWTGLCSLMMEDRETL